MVSNFPESASTVLILLPLINTSLLVPGIHCRLDFGSLLLVSCFKLEPSIFIIQTSLDWKKASLSAPPSATPGAGVALGAAGAAANGAAWVAVAEGGRGGGTVVKVGDSVLVGAAATCGVGCVDGPGTFAFEPLHQGTIDKGPDAGQRLKATIKMAARTHNPSSPPTIDTGISMLNLFPPVPSGVFEGWAMRVLPGAILVRAAAMRVAVMVAFLMASSPLCPAATAESAMLNSPAVAKRSAGLFAMAFSMMDSTAAGRLGFTSKIWGTGSVICLTTTAMGVVAW